MSTTTDRAVISVRDVGVRFHRGRRHRSLRDLLLRGAEPWPVGKWFV